MGIYQVFLDETGKQIQTDCEDVKLKFSGMKNVFDINSFDM